MFCNKCGAENQNSSKFCLKCGAPIQNVAGFNNVAVPNTQQPVNNTSVHNNASTYNYGQTYNNIPMQNAPRQNMPMQNNMYGSYYNPPKKKSKKKLWAVLAGFVAVAAAVGIFIGITQSDNNSGTGGTPVKPVIQTNGEIVGRTIMIYMIGSNLESDSGLATEDIKEFLEADSSDDVNIVLQTGGAKSWKYEGIEAGKVQRFKVEDNNLVELDKLGSLSMVETDTLTDFIEFSKENYPAEDYVLVMWNHGGGVPIGFGSDEIHDGELTDVEIGQAIEDADIHFESLIFNACEMCSLELFMAIKDNVDYVVACESSLYGYSLYGSGINHKNWINLAADKEVTAQQYCEQILDDYIKFLEKIDSKGSMSVVRMDRIDEVYEAYRDYMSEVYKDIKNGGYAGYMQARGECGYYEASDSVDLSTLASKYENDYSTALQNAVTNAVVRTKSDISYGHGITVYAPFEHAEYYNQGRESFETLDYDDDIIDCYDLIASKILYNSDLTAYAGNWYVEQQNESDVSHGQYYTLDYKDMGSYAAIALTPEDWSVVQNVTMYIYEYIESEDEVYVYGSDMQYTTDNNDYIKVAPPDHWLFLNECTPTISCIYRDYYDDGSVYAVYFAYAYVNNTQAYIRIDCTEDNPDGNIIGYYEADFENNEWGELCLFEDNDLVQLALQTYAGDETIYRQVGENFRGADIKSEVYNMRYDAGDSYYMSYEIEDVYGNIYETELIEVTN